MIVYVICIITLILLFLIYLFKKINIGFYLFFKNSTLVTYFFDRYYFNIIEKYLRDNNVYIFVSENKNDIIDDLKKNKTNNSDTDLKRLQIDYKNTLYTFVKSSFGNCIFLNIDNFYDSGKISYSTQRRLIRFFKRLYRVRCKVPVNGLVITIEDKIAVNDDKKETVEEQKEKEFSILRLVLKELQKYSDQSTPVYFAMVDFINTYNFNVESDFKKFKDIFCLVNDFGIEYHDFDDFYEKISLYIENKIDKILAASQNYLDCRNTVSFSHEIKTAIKNNLYSYYHEIYDESEHDISIPFNGVFFFNKDKEEKDNALNVIDSLKEVSNFYNYKVQTIKRAFTKNVFIYNLMNYKLFSLATAFLVFMGIFIFKTYSSYKFVNKVFGDIEVIDRSSNNSLNSPGFSVDQYKKNICKIFQYSTTVSDYSFRNIGVYMSYFNDPHDYVLNKYADKVGDVMLKSISKSIRYVIDDAVLESSQEAKKYTLDDVNNIIDKLSRLNSIRELMNTNKEENYEKIIHLSLSLISGEMCDGTEFIGRIAKNINSKALDDNFSQAFDHFNEKALSRITNVINSYLISYYSENEFLKVAKNLRENLDKMHLSVLGNNEIIYASFYKDTAEMAENFKYMSSLFLEDKYKWVVEQNPTLDAQISVLQKKVTDLNLVKDKEFIASYFQEKFNQFASELHKFKIDIFDKVIFDFDTKNKITIDKDVSDYINNIISILSYIDTVNYNGIRDFEINANQMYVWNLGGLKDAFEKTTAIDKIISGLDKSKFTSEMNTYYNKYTDFVFKAFWFNYLPVCLDTINPSTSFAKSLDSASMENNFLSSAIMLKSIMSMFSKYQTNKLLSIFYKIEEKNLENILLNATSALQNSRAYEPTIADFSSWNGDASPAFLAFNVASDDALKLALAKYRENILEVFNSKVSPFLNAFFDTLPVGANFESSSPVISSWVAIRKNIVDNSANSWLTILDDFILNKMNPLRLATCPAFLESSQLSQVAKNFFSDKRDKMLIALRNRCRDLYVEKAKSAYSTIIESYKQNIQNTFPFNAVVSGDVSPDISEFFSQIGNLNAFYETYFPFLTSKNNDSSFSSKQSNFIKSYKNLAETLNVAQDKDGNWLPIELNVAFNYRTNKDHEELVNQIIDWSLQIGSNFAGSRFAASPQKPLVWKYGDPVVLTLNLANSTNYHPEVLKEADRDANNFTVSYSYNSPWALMEFLAKNLSCTNLRCNDRLQFKVPLKGGKNIVLFSDIKITGKQKDKRLYLTDFQLNPVKW